MTRQTFGLTPLSVFLVLLVCSTIINCAKVEPPPGGPQDRFAPFLTGSDPIAGAINVPLDYSIALQFSEHIVRPASGKAIYISPRLPSDPKVRWKANQITVEPGEPLRPDQTYLVSVSSSVADLRGNKLDSTSVIAFSTGSTIDSGRVSGRVFAGDAPRGGMFVGLFSYGLIHDSTGYDSLFPEYVTQSTAEGRFSFQFLPRRRYQLIAFEDKDGDEHFNPTADQFGLADRPILLDRDSLMENLSLSARRQDTLVPEIISAVPTGDKLVRVRFSRPLSLYSLVQKPSHAVLLDASDTNIVYPAAGLLEADKGEASSVHFYLPPVPPGEYRLEIDYEAGREPLRFATLLITDTPDENPPSIASFTPDRKPRFVDDIELLLTFSEPLDTMAVGEATAVLLQDQTTQIDLTLHWLDLFRLRLEPSQLVAGSRYRLDLAEFDLIDLAGNKLGDSLTTYRFFTLDSDSLGSVSGRIETDIAGTEGNPVVLSFKKLGNQQEFALPVHGRRFTIDLPGGRYLLSGFIDRNFDGRRSLGSIYPFQLSETVGSYPDTIAVRARFETSDIVMEFK
ncbi:MAG: Ig-like domain-containing protein [Candidatus Zixiibacteriota bacterium]